MKTEKQIAAAAAEFATRWKGRGYERGESQPFWLDLLSNVFGIETPTDGFIRFEEHHKVDESNFVDGRIPTTRVLIEQKSLGKDLRAPIRQSDGALLNPFQQARRYVVGLPVSEHPRWIVTCNFSEFLIYDMEQPNGEPEQILLENLGKEYYRLMFLVDTKSEHLSKEMEVSMQAGEIVGKIYDALLAQYNDNSPEALRWLNILCVRIVFCLYAEDAGVFTHDQFHDYLVRYDAEDMRRALRDLFEVLNTPLEKRSKYLKEDLSAFPYTNGGLFEEDIEIPQFTEELKHTLLQNASLDFDWSEISPTIFGGVFESTLNPETRRSGGMHYTSIENIHKVIDPLFLNDLRRELDDILEEKVEKQRQQRLETYQQHLASLTFFDPACGSGNFLTETYLSLRRLENEALRERFHGQVMMGEFVNPVRVSIHQFYGIEINDFAVAVATTALWISEAQMLTETERIVHHDFDFLPLKSYTNIVEGNALRIDWRSVFTNRSAGVSPASDIIAGETPAHQQEEPEWHSRGYLPHIDHHRYQMITFRLYDSVPQHLIDEWKSMADTLHKLPDNFQAEQELRRQIDEYEDNGYGACYFNDARIAQLMVDALKHDDGCRYHLISYCIMPNHVHVLVEVFQGCRLADILHTWRSYVAHEANKLLGRTGTFWMKDYFDRFIRDEKHFQDALNYIEFNPVKARLVARPEDWPWTPNRRAGVSPASYITAGGTPAHQQEMHLPDYIIGNPPFVGARLMSEEQKQDVINIFGTKWKNVGNMDYVCCWYKKAVELLKENPNGRAALVSTNSICQGEQVANLWKPLFDEGLHIDFAYRTFRWDSEASLKAHVHCIIVGFSMGKSGDKVIYDNDHIIPANNINAYLTDAPNVFVESRTKPLFDVPEIGIGNKPIDGGNYLFEKEEMEEFIRHEPNSAKYFKPWYGSVEFIHQRPRYCLWLGDCSPAELRSMPHCLQRVQAVRDIRLASTSEGTRKLADRPTRFHVENMPEGNYIIVPSVSSERRRYVPMGFMPPTVLASNLVLIIPNATLYHFGVLTSNVHMAWMRAVCGRLKSDYRYSKDVVYNNFPWPKPTDEQQQRIAETAQAILDARALYPDSSLADLYDELTMPVELRRAHQQNDRAVMQAYGFNVKSMTESQCVAELFKLYQVRTQYFLFVPSHKTLKNGRTEDCTGNEGRTLQVAAGAGEEHR